MSVIMCQISKIEVFVGWIKNAKSCYNISVHCLVEVEIFLNRKIDTFLSSFNNLFIVGMSYKYEEDFILGQKGGGGRKQPREKKGKNDKKGAPTCYSAKHVRAKEAMMDKKYKQLNV